jgi:hypothetical protein
VYGSDDPSSVGDDMSVPNVPDLRPPLPPPPPADVVPYEEQVPVAPARRRTLTSGWRWVLACGWGTVMAGIGVVANTGFILGDPPFWTGNGLAVLPFVLPVLVLIALAGDWRYTIPLSFAAVAGTALIGFVDLFHARPMGYGELVFAFVGLLITLSAMAGLVPHPDEGKPAHEPDTPGFDL